MSSRVISCPNCGGAVEFKAGTSLLSVCPYCSSAVARVGDDVGQLEILGQVAPLAELGSPLDLGIGGTWGSLGFVLRGQVQYDHGTGPWNEWYAIFDDGRWGWLAEAQGRVYITFGQEVSGLPIWSEAEVGRRFEADAHTLTIVEKKVAQFLSARGEVPFAAPPGQLVRYVDLQGGDGLFGTIDFTEDGAPDRLFLGHELTYDALFDGSVLRDVAPGQAAAAVGLNCPNCGASVEIQAPDESQRITCGTCGALLDCSEGHELYLLSSAVPRIPQPLIPLGATGELEGLGWTVYGQLLKSVEAWGEVYRWTEYLLRKKGGGWRWLIESDGHWSFVDPVDAGDVFKDSHRRIRYDGTTYRRFSSASARVDGLRGEFYWKVAVGDRVGAVDYVRPPLMISEERTSEEITFSKVRYLEPREIQAAFSLQHRLPHPQGIAPHQPNPHGRTLRRMARIGGVLTGLLALLAFGMALTSRAETAANVEVQFRPESASARSASGVTKGQTIGPLRFSLEDQSNLAVRANADIQNGALFLSGKLTNTTLGETRSLGVRIEHYGGYSGGEPWSSGSRTRAVLLGALKPGNYQLELDPEWYGSSSRPPSQIRLRIVEDVFLGSHAFFSGVLLWILPIIGLFRYFAFEKRRWSESDFAE